MSPDSELFYSGMAAHKMPLGTLLGKPALFSAVPADWQVIITDIKDSTTAVLNGAHEQVNFVATGSIVCVLNIVFGTTISVPFFFGGDGATFIVPPSVFPKVMAALALYKISVRDNYGLELRTGSVGVDKLYRDGHELLLARFRSSETFAIPVLLGQGLAHAERLIKGPDYLFAEYDSADQTLDLTGMQCRWDTIPPPEDREEVVTLLVVAVDPKQQAQAFRDIMDEIDRLYGAPPKRQPISVAKLRLKTTFNRLGKEIKVRLGKMKFFELLKSWLTMILGPFYFRTTKGQHYLRQLVEMSDTLVMDGKINTVMSGSAVQRKALIRFLDALEAKNTIRYGIHLSGASIMSCYVRDLKDDHIHFVDGAEGGYTKAAMVLKAKLKAIEEA